MEGNPRWDTLIMLKIEGDLFKSNVGLLSIGIRFFHIFDTAKNDWFQIASLKHV